MKASTRKCSEVSPCNLMNCYACRRRLIDQTATAMLNAGATPEAVDQYRCPAINALAFEIQSPEPKAPTKAHKGFTPKAGIDYQAMADKLRVAGDRGYAAHVLVGRTIAELKHIWTLAARTDRIPSQLRKDGVVSYMIENLVGYRLDTRSILKAK